MEDIVATSDRRSMNNKRPLQIEDFTDGKAKEVFKYVESEKEEQILL